MRKNGAETFACVMLFIGPTLYRSFDIKLGLRGGRDVISVIQFGFLFFHRGCLLLFCGGDFDEQGYIYARSWSPRLMMPWLSCVASVV